MSVEFYVAFSKHNTNTFITANKVVDYARPKRGDSVMLDNLQFDVSEPRQGSSLRNGVKLLAKDLRADSTPQTVFDFFQKLKTTGWNVNDAAFIKRHNLKLPETASVSVSTPVNVSAPTENVESQSNTETQINSTETVPAAASETPAPSAPAIINKIFRMGPRQTAICEVLAANALPMTLANIQEGLKTSGTKLAPSDLKAALNGLQKQNIVTFDGENVTAYTKL